MNIALIQTNPIIGDFAGNAAKITAYAEEAARRGCRLAVFPELALPGAPAQDLLERPGFAADQCQALATLLTALPPEMFVLFGCIETNDGPGKKLFNSAVTAHGGRIIHRARKKLFATDGVFDDSRYFAAGELSPPLVIDGQSFAVTIGEDIWGEDIGPEAAAGLAARLNIAALPFARGQEKTRKEMFSRLARRFQTALVHCNQAGGQDGLIFPGRSMAFDGEGELAAIGKAFAEDMIVIDTQTWQGERHGPSDGAEDEDTLAALTVGLADYARKCGFRQVVLGLSGGIDSALVAAVACRALGPENVLAVAIPSACNPQESLADAEALAKNLGCDFAVIPISSLVDAFGASLAPFFAGTPEGLAEQNAQARIRGNLLMALANKFNRLPLATGNKSEMAVGYCTLYGDMCGGLAVIADCLKDLVYRLSALINREREIIPRRIIEKAPSAELKPGQRDQDDLPPYPVLDAILERYLEQGQSQAEIVAAGFDQMAVADILRRIRVSEYKRQQAPLVLRVSGKAFGHGWRYPICQDYRG